MATASSGERNRLHALKRYEVLDSLPEAEFDRITRLVARQLQVPIAFINFIDESRGWFKAVHGTLIRQQDRNMSVCNYAIQQPEVLAVPDLMLDPRFREKDISLDTLKVRSYIGAPLITPDGLHIGTLSAVDATPRTYSADQHALLQDLAAVVIDELELRLAIRKWREADQRSSYAAEHDALTGLPNRVRFLDHAEVAIHQAQRQGTGVAVLMIDLDHFKHVNDSLGHHTGDALLSVIAKRLADSMRIDDTLARFGGDEFVILLTELIDPLNAAWFADRILTQLHDPVDLERYTLQISASIGIAVFPGDFQDVPALLQAADIAMYHAKQQGGGRVCFHTEQMSVDAAQKLHHHMALERAVQSEAFELYYQPQVDLRSQEVIGVEALLRWPQHDGSVRLPEEFIPLAEQTGLILPLGVWVLREACAQLQRWRSQDRMEWKVAVNVAAQQWNASEFIDQVTAALHESGLPPSCLVLELTESHVIGNLATAQHILAALDALGVQVSLDDFGMGYSNLGQLMQLPFRQLKLDRSFIASMSTDRRYEALVRNSINLARDLGMLVVGEGIESQVHCDLLIEWGCAVGQGFLFGRPVPAAAYLSPSLEAAKNRFEVEGEESGDSRIGR